MVGRILQPEIKGLIDSRNFSALRELFSDWPPADVAEVILDMPENEQVIIFRVLPHDLAADVFEYLDVEAQQQLLRGMAHEQVVGILNEMSPDDRTALLEELPSAVARQLIRLLTPEERRIAQALLGYPEDSVGRLMTPDFIAVHSDWTVKEVLDHVREDGKDSETLNVIYVVDERGKLIDDIRIREFLVQPLTDRVSDLMDSNFVSLSVMEPERDAVNVFRKYDRTALPVTDSAGILVGIVTIDDMLDVAEEEATEDIQKFGGMEALEEPYMRVPLLSMVWKRAPWLMVLLLGEMLTATAMAYYETEIAKAVVLAVFLPMIISSGGNSGSQASTLIIRAMALGEVTLRDWWRVMRRELSAGALLGLCLGYDRGYAGDRLVVSRQEISAPGDLRRTLAPGRCHRRHHPGGRCSLGLGLRFDVAFRAAPCRARSGHFIGAVRGHSGRCHRGDHLFQHRAADHARNDVVG